MAKRTVGKPFEKGKSGNPSGRPKVVKEIRELARAHGEDAFRRVLALMKSNDHRISLTAAQEVLNRAYGKPPQTMSGEGGEGPAKLVIEWLKSNES